MSKTVTHSASVSRSDLRRALSFATMAVERGGSIPILGTVLMSFSAGRAKIIGTNLDMECLFQIEAETASKFSICASPRYLEGVALSGTGDRVEIEADFTTTKQTAKDGKEHSNTDIICRVRAGDLEAAFRSVLPADDFPLFGDDRLQGTPDRGAATTVLSEKDLYQILHDTIPSISKEETRYYLNGVYLHAKEEGRLLGVATDGHRLTLRKTEVPYPPELHGILPATAAKTLYRVLKPGGNATLTLTGTQLIQRITPNADDWRMTFKLIDGTFPNYTMVIPKKAPTWSVPLSLGMVKRIMPFMTASPWGSERHLKFDLDQKRMSATLSDRSEIGFPITGADGEGKVGFNAYYLRDILSRHSPARIGSSGSGEPAIVQGEDPNVLNVIMPVRV